MLFVSTAINIVIFFFEWMMVYMKIIKLFWLSLCQRKHIIRNILLFRWAFNPPVTLFNAFIMTLKKVIG